MEPNFEVLPPGRAPGPPGPPPKPKPRGLQSVVLAIGVVLLKFKTVASMALSIWLYSFAWGWPFAAGFVLLIFVHEMGHVVAAKWLGMPVSAPLFIPFIGASIIMKQNPRDAWTEALMAYGGPLAGGAGAWVCWWAALQWQVPWMMAVASTAFVINLFNLIPIPPLDGGRICAAVSPRFWFVGLFLLGASLLLFHGSAAIIIVVIVVLVALPRLKQTLLVRHTPEMERYYSVGFARRITMALMYLGLIAVLLFGYWEANVQLGWMTAPAAS
jgi:Zn-dependent protease